MPFFLTPDPYAYQISACLFLNSRPRKDSTGMLGLVGSLYLTFTASYSARLFTAIRHTANSCKL